MDHFKVDRADNCIWLIDERDEGQQTHFTPDQAQKVGKALLNISFKGLNHTEVAGRIEVNGQ